MFVDQTHVNQRERLAQMVKTCRYFTVITSIKTWITAIIWLIMTCKDLIRRSQDEECNKTSAPRTRSIDLLLCTYGKMLQNNQSLLSFLNPVGWLSVKEPRPEHQCGYRGDWGKDKALSIALHFPSTLFLNHPGLNVLFCPIGSLPFQYIHREPALNKHLPATCSFALMELPSSI